MEKEKHIFIAHCGEHEDAIEDFKSLVSNRTDYSFKDSSLTKDNPNNAKDKEYIKSIIRDHIKWASTVIVLIGKETVKTDWIDQEIQMAHGLNKQIIGVYLPTEYDYKIPEALKKYGDALVRWDVTSIEKALSGGQVWQNPNGSPCPDNKLGAIDC